MMVSLLPISLRLETRTSPSWLMMMAAPLLGAGALCVAGALLLHLSGNDPSRGLYTLFLLPLSTAAGIGDVVHKATPLALCGVGLALAFRADVHNMGADGQLTLGAISASLVALVCGSFPASAVLLMMLVAGAFGGMAWAAVPATLRTRFGASEVLVSLMLVPVAHLLLRYLVREPLRDPSAVLHQSLPFPAEARLAPLVAGWPLTTACLLGLAGVGAAWLMMKRPSLQRGAPASVWATLLCSGAFAGFAGAVEVAGPLGRLDGTVTASYGLAAIVAAYLGRLHPAGVLTAALLMALLHTGGQAAQATLGWPAGSTVLFQGLALMCLLAANMLVHFRLRPAGRKSP